MKDVSLGEQNWVTIAGNNIRQDQHICGVECALRILRGKTIYLLILNWVFRGPLNQTA